MAGGKCTVGETNTEKEDNDRMLFCVLSFLSVIPLIFSKYSSTGFERSTVSKVEPSGAIKTRFNTHQGQACLMETSATLRTEVSDVQFLKQRKQRAQMWKRSSNVTTQMRWLHTDFTQSVVPRCRWVDGLARAQGRTKTKVRPRPFV